MKFIFFLAIKNLFRYYKRTLITAISIALGIGITIWMDGMLKWGNESSQRNLINYETSSIKIGNRKFFEDEEYVPLSETIKEKDKIISLLKQKNIPFTEELKFMAGVINEITGEGYSFIGMGIEPSTHTNVYQIHKSMLKGDFLKRNNINSVLISKYTADLLEMDIGDYVILKAQTKYGVYNADSFLIEGIFDTPNPEVNRYIIYISRKTANLFLDMEEEINLIGLKISDDIEEMKEELRKEFSRTGIKDIDLKTWKDQAADYLAASQGDKGGTAIMLFLVFVIVAVGIANTMLMAVFERTGEIGMMRAMGSTNKEIMLNFIFEAGGIGFIGGVLGIIIGSITQFFMITYGLDFSNMFGDISYGYRTAAVWYSKWNPDIMIFCLFFSIIMSIIISIFPSRRAIKMNITDTLKNLEGHR